MKQLVAYITAGFPDKHLCVDVAFALCENGVDKIELGVPFSDPVADGPIIEKANLSVLKQGFKMDDLFDVSKIIAPKIPTYWMGYFNPFYHKGLDYFAAKAIQCNLCGFLIPDLPHEEAKGYKHLVEGMGLSLIDFIAPTHNKERVKQIAQNSKDFIYLVAYAGITGAKQDENLDNVISIIKNNTQTPVFVGFGVNEKTAKAKAKGADGVIVGSAFVEILLDERLTGREKVDKISHLSAHIKELINE